MRKTGKVSSFGGLLLGKTDTTTVEQRVFNVVVLMIFFIGVVTTISNIGLDLPLSHVLLTVVIACSGLSAYLFSRLTERFETISMPVSFFFMLLLVVGWMIDNGSLGSTGYAFLVVTTGASLYLRDRRKHIFITVFLATMVALVSIEWKFPAWLMSGHTNRIQRLMDISGTMFFCMVIVWLMVHIVIQQQREDRRKMSQLIEELRVLRGILPICSNCQKIRNDKGYWSELELYIENHAGVKFSHGLCPECAQKLYPGFVPPDHQ